MILRDDHDATWTDAADSTLDRRVYYCQNWRADVVALLAPNGRLLERAWYEPYGTPHGSSNGDFSGTSDDTNDHYLVPDGDVDADDQFVFLDLDGLDHPLSDMTGDSDPGDPEYGRPNGVIDADDFFFFLDCANRDDALGRNQLSAGHDGVSPTTQALRNRRGLAGYEWDPAVKRYHVRNRVLYPEIGRWTRRDPMGYVDGAGLYEYVQSAPIDDVDEDGLIRRRCRGYHCGSRRNFLPIFLPIADPGGRPPPPLVIIGNCVPPTIYDNPKFMKALGFAQAACKGVCRQITLKCVSECGVAAASGCTIEYGPDCPGSRRSQSTFLAHELRHVGQFCLFGDIDDSSAPCRERICRELDAYLRASNRMALNLR